MNKDGKIKGKFNIIDLLAIILVIAVAVGIGVRFRSTITSTVKADEEFVYTVKVTGVKSYTVKALEKKGKITDMKSEMHLGEITDVEYEPCTTEAERADGKIVNTEQPERYNVMVTIKAYGKEIENSYVTDDSNELSVGRITDIYTKYVHTTGKIMTVKKVTE